MDSEFQIKLREGLARIGTFNTKHGSVSTPTLMPVLDPLRPNQLNIDEIVQIGAEILITNAYLCYRNEKIHDVVKKKGLHKYINFSGPIMTDSGAFQLMGYGKVSVTNEEITRFQEDIGVDIGVFLDVPVANGTYEETSAALDKTIQRANEHIKVRKTEELIWAGPIQGGKYLDLVERSAKAMADLPFQIHAIGSVVPLLENYEYLTVASMITTAKQYLPFNRPVHLFGAGHPMIFSLAVYLGIDLFDSAAYWLFAKAGRYMTSSGSFHLSDLEYFPCGCKYCSSTTPKDVRNLNKEDKILFLAKHNLSISFIEINIIRQAIKDGRLWNLVLQRSTSHPDLTRAITYIKRPEIVNFLEKFASISYKKSRLYAHLWATNTDPLVKRFHNRVLTRFPVLYPYSVIYSDKLPDKFHGNSLQKIQLHPIFGLIPQQWQSIYPIMQHLSFSNQIGTEIVDFVNKWLDIFKTKFTKIYNTTEYDFQGTIPTTYNELANYVENIQQNRSYQLDDRNQILAMIQYQFNVEKRFLLTLEDISVERSKKSSRIKEFSVKGERWGTIRASDSVIIPAKPMITWLYRVTAYPSNRIIVTNEVKGFIKDGKSAFCKFCDSIDPQLRPGDEVLIVTSEDELLGWGQLQYTGDEMMSFTKGIVVKTRGGFAVKKNNLRYN